MSWPLAQWGWGAVAAEVASAADPFALIDASPDAHARRLATAESLNVEAGVAEYHLVMEWVSDRTDHG
ncbi:hypothetical protein [Sorangium sp. So ce381]|uniref:hypothetical protein n=1 Tax=Sorangium sp. So ce381 TaxID=3133307 RepID=UPI003F5B3C89